MPVVMVVAALMVLVAAGWTLLNLRTRAHPPAAGVSRPQADRLVYVVPEGRDPAVLIAELGKANFASEFTEDAGRRRIVIACINGMVHDRGEVREVIERAGSVIDDPSPTHASVYFEDESVR